MGEVTSESMISSLMWFDDPLLRILSKVPFDMWVSLIPAATFVGECSPPSEVAILEYVARLRSAWEIEVHGECKLAVGQGGSKVDSEATEHPNPKLIMLARLSCFYTFTFELAPVYVSLPQVDIKHRLSTYEMLVGGMGGRRGGQAGWHVFSQQG